MAVFTDDFNRANGGLGANWASVESTLTIASNKVTVGSAANGLSRTASVFSGANQTASLDVSSYFQANNNVGVCVRFDASACYLFALRNSATNTYRLFQYAGASSFTLLGTAVNATVPSLPATITCEINGSVLTGKVNGVAVITHTLVSDPLSANRKGGIFVNDQSTADNFTMDDVSTDTISITTPQANQIIQRTGTTFAGGTASIAITGTYTGTPTTIEARFAGGTWTTIVASPSGGTYTGTLSSQAAGQGAVEVRFSSNTGITASVADVGIGEVFAAFGQSNAVCLATNPQSWSAPAAYAHYKPGMQKYNSSAWALLADHPFNTTEEPAAVGKGSCYPRIATLLMKELGVPVGFVTTGKGTTGLVGGSESPKLNHWNKTGTGANAHTQYDKAVTTANLAGINAIRAILWYQGEADTLGTGAGDNAGRAAYSAAVSTLLDNFQADCASLASAKLICATLGEYSSNPSTSSTDLTTIRMAQVDAIDADADVFFGPVGYDQDLSDNAHWATDGQITRLANLWFCSVMSALFSGPQGYSPRIVSILSTGSNLAITFDRDLLSSDSSYGTAAFFASDGSGTLTISSATRTGTREVTLACSRAISGTASVSLGRGTSAVGLTVPRSAAITLPDATTVSLTAAPFELQTATGSSSSITAALMTQTIVSV